MRDFRQCGPNLRVDLAHVMRRQMRQPLRHPARHRQHAGPHAAPKHAMWADGGAGRGHVTPPPGRGGRRRGSQTPPALPTTCRCPRSVRARCAPPAALSTLEPNWRREMKKGLFAAAAVVALMGTADAETPQLRCVTVGVVNVNTLPMAADKMWHQADIRSKTLRQADAIWLTYPTGLTSMFLLAMLIRKVSNGIGAQETHQDMVML